MSFGELLLIAVGLSMDAFAVAVCEGLSMRGGLKRQKMLLIALLFGLFQAMMPLIGYFLGSQFAAHIRSVDHWVAFVLLALIGVNMIRESGEETKESARSGFRQLVLLAIATSIDALAVGIAFVCTTLPLPILASVGCIGITTFLLSLLGVAVGNRFGTRWRGAAEKLGGGILILIGLKILLTDLGVLVLPF